MVELNTLAKMFEEQLNNNKYGIVFDIAADRNTYDKRKNKAADFVVPGVLTAQTGNYEPLQGIKVYYMPINLELFAFAGLHNEPFTWEQQKECFEKLVSDLNGTTQLIGENVVAFAGAVVTVGNATGQSGSSYLRIPALVQLQLTVVEEAELSNNEIVMLDGERIYTTEFSVNMEKQSESMAYVGQANVQSVSAALIRTFSGVMYLTKNQFYKTLESDMLDNTDINKTHTLIYKERNYTVISQSMSELLRMGAIVILQATFIEG